MFLLVTAAVETAVRAGEGKTKKKKKKKRRFRPDGADVRLQTLT